MEINFNPVKGGYEAEFVAQADFNLHIETEEGKSVQLYQRGTPEGKYAFVASLPCDGEGTIDTDVASLIHPKCIKLFSGTPVVAAYYTEG